jgi:hypothetical protein
MRCLPFTVAASFLVFGLTAVPAPAADAESIPDPLAPFDVLLCEAETQGDAILLKAGNGLVQTKRQYADFVISYEWKALKEEKWDSGLYFRYAEVPAGRPWPPRYQVNLDVGKEGDLVGFKDGKNTVPLNPREWNTFVLTVQGDEASLTVNGKPSWKVKGIEQPRGYIALQAEIPKGGQFLFRNVQVTELK